MDKSKFFIAENFCSYGCGNIAKYNIGNSKKCCEKIHTKCPEVRRKNSISQLGKKMSRESRLKMRLSHIGQKKSRDFCLKRKEAMLGSNNPMYGRTWKMSDETKKKISSSLKGRMVGCRNPMFGRNGSKHPLYGKEPTNETKEKIKRSLIKRWKEDVNLRKKHSTVFKRMWNNPNSIYNSDEWRKNLYQACSVKPNNLELCLQEILDNLFPNQYEYTGNFSFWIGNKNPDFVCHSKKLVIEAFGSYWHSKEVTGIDENIHEENKKLFFNRLGYQCLVIWDEELKDIAKVKKTLANFHNRNYRNN